MVVSQDAYAHALTQTPPLHRPGLTSYSSFRSMPAHPEGLAVTPRSPRQSRTILQTVAAPGPVDGEHLIHAGNAAHPGDPVVNMNPAGGTGRDGAPPVTTAQAAPGGPQEALFPDAGGDAPATPGGSKSRRQRGRVNSAASTGSAAGGNPGTGAGTGSGDGADGGSSAGHATSMGGRRSSQRRASGGRASGAWGGRTRQRWRGSVQPSCSYVHVPYRHRRAPFEHMKLTLCQTCGKKLVPETLLSTLEPPPALAIRGPPMLIQARVAAFLPPASNDEAACVNVSQHLFFVENDVLRQLLYKLRIANRNAAFALRSDIHVSARMIVATVTASAVLVEALPPPRPVLLHRPRLLSGQGGGSSGERHQAMQLEMSQMQQRVDELHAHYAAIMAVCQTPPPPLRLGLTSYGSSNSVPTRMWADRDRMGGAGGGRFAHTTHVSQLHSRRSRSGGSGGSGSGGGGGGGGGSGSGGGSGTPSIHDAGYHSMRNTAQSSPVLGFAAARPGSGTSTVGSRHGHRRRRSRSHHSRHSRDGSPTSPQGSAGSNTPAVDSSEGHAQHSGSGEAAAGRPQVSLDFTTSPVPTTSPLLGGGGGGAVSAGRGRRRHRTRSAGNDKSSSPDSRSGRQRRQRRLSRSSRSSSGRGRAGLIALGGSDPSVPVTSPSPGSPGGFAPAQPAVPVTPTLHLQQAPPPRGLEPTRVASADANSFVQHQQGAGNQVSPYQSPLATSRSVGSLRRSRSLSDLDKLAAAAAVTSPGSTGLQLGQAAVQFAAPPPPLGSAASHHTMFAGQGRVPGHHGGSGGSGGGHHHGHTRARSTTVQPTLLSPGQSRVTPGGSGVSRGQQQQQGHSAATTAAGQSYHSLLESDHSDSSSTTTSLSSTSEDEGGRGVGVRRER